MRWRDVFFGEFAAGAEEELVHLLDEELLGFFGPGLEAVLVEEHLLALDPFAPGFLGDVLVDLLAEVGVEGRFVEAFHFGFVFGAENHVRHCGAP
jgi:hypothetical protein